MTWDDATAAIESFRQLAHGWDGEGGDAPTAEIVDAALKLANRLRDSWDEPDRVIVGVNADIILEWRSSNEYREVSVANPVSADVVRCRTNCVERSTIEL